MPFQPWVLLWFLFQDLVYRLVQPRLPSLSYTVVLRPIKLAFLCLLEPDVLVLCWFGFHFLAGFLLSLGEFRSWLGFYNFVIDLGWSLFEGVCRVRLLWLFGDRLLDLLAFGTRLNSWWLKVVVSVGGQLGALEHLSLLHGGCQVSLDKGLLDYLWGEIRLWTRLLLNLLTLGTRYLRWCFEVILIRAVFIKHNMLNWRYNFFMDFLLRNLKLWAWCLPLLLLLLLLRLWTCMFFLFLWRLWARLQWLLLNLFFPLRTWNSLFIFFIFLFPLLWFRTRS